MATDPGSGPVLLAFAAFGALGFALMLIVLAMKKAQEANLKRFPPPTPSDRLLKKIAQREAEFAARQAAYRATHVDYLGSPDDARP